MFDVIVIGGGPSGMSAALNLKRSGRSVLIIEKESFGGQIATSPRVENIAGKKEISGTEFASNFFDQIVDLGVEFEIENVLEIKKVDNHFHIKTDFNEHDARCVIIANGVKHRKFNIPNEEELIGKGISFCAVCDGAFFANEDVCLVGDANTALQYALALSKYCKNVYLYTLFDKFFGDYVLVERIKQTKNIIVKHNLSLKEIIGKDHLEKLIFTNTISKKDEDLIVKGLFIAIGQIPNNDIFKDLVELNKGFIVVNDKMETKTPGLYAVGDTTNKLLRQVSTAVNDGAIAAFFANNYLN